MTYSYTETRTFTMLHARYVTSKIAADLDLVRTYYLRPSVDEITAYAEEAAILLNERYLNTVEYGFKRDDKVIFSVKYIARSDGTLQADDRPGRIPAGMDISGTVWYSYLTYTSAYDRLSSVELASLKAKLPVPRFTSAAPVSGSGYWEQSRSYSANGEGVVRNIFRPL